ncbi:hypothetical protein FOZ63_031637, partial [Perkinsus olseni]
MSILEGGAILWVSEFIIRYCPRKASPISSLHDQSDTTTISAPSTAPSSSPPLNIKGRGSIGDCTNSIDDGDHPRTAAAAAASGVLVANNCTRPPRASRSGCNYAAVDEGKRTEERHAAAIPSSSSWSDAAAPQVAVNGGHPSAAAAAAVADDYQRKKRIQGDYAYFVKNTYSKQ